MKGADSKLLLLKHPPVKQRRRRDSWSYHSFAEITWRCISGRQERFSVKRCRLLLILMTCSPLGTVAQRLQTHPDLSGRRYPRRGSSQAFQSLCGVLLNIIILILIIETEINKAHQSSCFQGCRYTAKPEKHRKQDGVPVR